MTGPDVDVAVIGDGPAGLALADACASRGLGVVVVGDDRPWTATYGMWVDEIPDLLSGCFGHVSPTVVVHGRRRHVVEGAYGVVDTATLWERLDAAVERAAGRATGVQHFTWGSRVLIGAAHVDARLIARASGSAGRPTAWQTAYGIVVDEPPPRFDQDVVTLMDLRSVVGGGAQPTFCYVVPVADGWLVEETVMAARPAVDPASLRDRLAARVGAPVVESARRVEMVVIPLGGPLPNRRDPVVAFGAAAGYTHPATGYSVAMSLRAAPRVAGAIAEVVSNGGLDTRGVWDAVWPRAARRTRLLHDHGLEVLLRLSPNELSAFFDAFFELPEPLWSAYLRVDASAADVSRAMTAVLRRLPRPVRRRVLATTPWASMRRRGAP